MAKCDRSIDSFDKMVDPYRSVLATIFISSFIRVHRMIILCTLIHIYVRSNDAIHLAKNKRKKAFPSKWYLEPINHVERATQ